MISSRRVLCLCLCLLALGGCEEQMKALKTWAGKGSNARAAYPITPARESWCYRTLGEIECYPQPQDLPPDSLVSVDPPSHLPLSRSDHAKAFGATQPLPGDAVEKAESAPAAQPQPLAPPAPAKK